MTILTDATTFDEEIATCWAFAFRTFFNESLYHARLTCVFQIEYNV